jgi:hypothetical protein
LPDLPCSLQQAINLVCGSALDPLHDLRDAIEAISIVERAQHKMYVIGHYDYSVQLETLTISPETSIEHEAPSSLGQDPSVMRRERYENGFMVFLKVRKMSAVFVLAFHLLKYYHDWQARARTPAPTLGDVVPKQND